MLILRNNIYSEFLERRFSHRATLSAIYKPDYAIFAKLTKQLKSKMHHYLY